ncbi:MAG: class I SAM-dependent methyltransferase [Acidobacterium ailaaui]|nr:class I SAM-dependent methyltransferase [Pseudacidobacterium ailaaui]
MELFASGLEAYAARYTSPESALLQEIAAYTQAHTSRPGMMSGHVQGVFLQMISYMIRPQHVLEIGTFTGYSAVCLAAGLQPGGYIITIDRDAQLHQQVKQWIEKNGLTEKIRLKTGQALDILPALSETFDLVFIDADKENYVRYYELIFDRVRPGGFILADNVLFHGEVLELPEQQSKAAKAIQMFNAHVAADARVDQVLLTIRDGLLLIRKK